MLKLAPSKTTVNSGGRKNTVKLLTLVLAVLLLAGCAARPAAVAEGTLEVHFIDVGQADSVLITDGEAAVLIDAGNNGDGELVTGYLESQGIKRLDMVVGTHLHEDHIGGLDVIISRFEVAVLMMPDIEADSRTYSDVLSAAAGKKLAVTHPEAGREMELGGFRLQILGPVKEYGDANNSSIVIKILFGSTSFLFTGDIEREAEADIIDMGFELECDVLKAPHHGSSTSSNYVFLRQSNPEMIVVSCGAGNSYGHPHEEPMSRYRDLGAVVYRTDLLGTIVMTSDGAEIKANVKGEESPVDHTSGGDTDIILREYIGNRNSRVFHLPECKNLPKEENRVLFTSRGAAVSEGYSPCGNCKP